MDCIGRGRAPLRCGHESEQKKLEPHFSPSHHPEPPLRPSRRQHNAEEDGESPPTSVPEDKQTKLLYKPTKKGKDLTWMSKLPQPSHRRRSGRRRGRIQGGETYSIAAPAIPLAAAARTPNLDT